MKAAKQKRIDPVKLNRMKAEQENEHRYWIRFSDEWQAYGPFKKADAERRVQELNIVGATIFIIDFSKNGLELSRADYSSR